MNGSIDLVIYLLIYFVTILYFVVLGCYMLMRRDDVLVTRGELVAKQRLVRSVGLAMLLWAFLWFLYLPPVMYGMPSDHVIYRLIFLVTMMLFSPLVYVVMFAVVQRQVNTRWWAVGVLTPYLLLTVWQLAEPDNLAPSNACAAVVVVTYLVLLLKFSGEYRLYVQRMRSEYSDTTRRDILWAWVAFSGFALQGILYVGYVVLWTPVLEIPYQLLTIMNAACLCFCACRQRAIDLDVVPEEDAEKLMVERQDEKAFYAEIEDKLKTMCEQKLLFLDPDITREMLCLRLSINRTYLGMYFRSRDLTFYQYINSLRVEYAYRLMQDNPNMSIRKVSEQSGFRSVTTFRKVFQDVMGCLPSEIKTK